MLFRGIRKLLNCKRASFYAAIATTVVTIIAIVRFAPLATIETPNEVIYFFFFIMFQSVHRWYHDFITYISLWIGSLWFLWNLFIGFFRRPFRWFLIRGFLFRTRWCVKRLAFEYITMHSLFSLRDIISWFKLSWCFRWYRVLR
jgi:hypothetical protein